MFGNRLLIICSHIEAGRLDVRKQSFQRRNASAAPTPNFDDTINRRFKNAASKEIHSMI
jgi:hypothetical protein